MPFLRVKPRRSHTMTVTLAGTIKLAPLESSHDIPPRLRVSPFLCVTIPLRLSFTLHNYLYAAAVTL